MAIPAARVLLVLDDPDLTVALERALPARGLETWLASSTTELARACDERIFELVVLSERVVGPETVEVCRTLAAAHHGQRVLAMLAAPSAARPAERELALYDAGACDCVAEDTEPAVIAAKIGVHVRQAPLPTGQLRRLGRLVVDGATKAALVDGHALDLTPTEFAILRRLADSPDAVVTRSQLAASVWGATASSCEGTLSTHLHRLKAKLRAALGREVIESIKGRGCVLRLTLTPALGRPRLVAARKGATPRAP